MLKVRLMGTKNDIAWFQKILQRHPKIEVMERQMCRMREQCNSASGFIKSLHG